jgi:hypothetical protein
MRKDGEFNELEMVVLSFDLVSENLLSMLATNHFITVGIILLQSMVGIAFNEQK